MTSPEGLTEIILTPDKGFVIEETQEPIEVLGGVTLFGVVTKYSLDEIRKGVIDFITRVHSAAFDVMKLRPNGYIIHLSSPLGEVSNKMPLSERDYMTSFSALEYRMK